MRVRNAHHKTTNRHCNLTNVRLSVEFEIPNMWLFLPSNHNHAHAQALMHAKKLYKVAKIFHFLFTATFFRQFILVYGYYFPVLASPYTCDVAYRPILGFLTSVYHTPSQRSEQEIFLPPSCLSGDIISRPGFGHVYTNGNLVRHLSRPRIRLARISSKNFFASL